MAFSGFLIKCGGSNGTVLPMKYIKAESYTCTPDQRMESKASRAVTGLLHRTTCSHTATKIEINTVPMMTNTELKALLKIISDKYTDLQQRKLTLYYYDNELDSYATGDFYVPDIDFPIMRVEGNTIYYDSIRIAFIEY